jgi:hypothetical protein
MNMTSPDILVATHVDLLELLRVIRAEILTHLDSHMLGQHGEQQSFLENDLFTKLP